MIKNILKLSIATALLLGTTVVGMDAGDVLALGDDDINVGLRSSVGGAVTAEVPPTNRIPVGNRPATGGLGLSALLNMGAPLNTGVSFGGEIPTREINLSALFSGGRLSADDFKALLEGGILGEGNLDSDATIFNPLITSIVKDLGGSGGRTSEKDGSKEGDGKEDA